MNFIKTQKEIEAMTKAGFILGQLHNELKKRIKPGITLLELNKFAHNFIKLHGAIPAFLGYNGYQYVICTSVNDTLIHGVPSNYKLVIGDLLSIDAGVNYKGYFSDAAFSVIVGDEKNALKSKLIKVTEEALKIGIENAKPGVNLKTVGKLIEDFIVKKGFFVVKSYCGHGIGSSLHEEPWVLNFYDENSDDFILKSGMTIAIEPMVMLNDTELYTDNDGWSVKTIDGSLTCHFEHTILIQPNKNKILSKT